MTEQTPQQGRVGRAALAVMEQAPRLTPEKLCARLRAMTVRLRRHYTLANASNMRRPVDEWLCDNYYVLEKESKQTARDIRQLARGSVKGELMRIYQAVEQVLRGEMPPLTEETLTEMLEAVGTARPLSERQFAFVPAAVKAALVGIAYGAVTETEDTERMAYAITGFSRLTSVELEAVVRRCSGVEQILLEDPAGVYPDMTDESRAWYRHMVARIAHESRCGEQEVAREALDRARADGGHVGGYLLGHKAVVKRKRRRGALALAADVLLPLALSLAAGFWSGELAVAFLCFLPLWEILRTPIQQVALAGVDVDYIPRMELKRVGEKPATVVLVSTLLPKVADVPALEQRLEQLYFSNSDPDMYYCVLADFGECEYPADDKDESQIEAAKKAVEALNRKHGARFMLFLRGRVWNATQRRYSGWERKRGAITEFIRFLKGKKTSLHTFVGERGVLSRIKFIIALDSDTNMLYESAQTLVSAAMHPLNRPVVGADGVVESGYGILVPKISTDLASAKATGFSRVMSGCGGVTAYETRDKDFYQDLFGESIFAGKGLIDVDAFYEVLDRRFPENRVLSHDILEGAYLRCGFLSDVEMTDTAPTGMAQWLSRLHRWLRGDWQNITFTARRYRAQGKSWENPISTLSKYKLFDNLRRSLTPVAALLCLIAALIAPPRAHTLLAWAGVLAVTFSSLWSALWSLSAGGFFSMSRKFFTRTLPHTFELVGQALLLLIMLPAQAFLTVDAAVRSLWRALVSHKHLLEWTTAAQSERGGKGFGAVLRRLWLPELFGLLFLAASARTALAPVGICFALVLPVAYYSARRTSETARRISGADRDTLVGYNAAMWRYYEEFANKQNHFLPPDNIQQSPVFRVATRTSPTNIGMMLLSALAARDFDFIDTDGLYRRIDRTLATIEALPKWHGNLYNWYDTATLDTLKPEFVSTVDSGNFVCSLVALKEGLREYTVEKRELKLLIARCEALIDATDLTVFYDEKKRLFSIGYDVPTEALVNSHYDFLMSEARLTSYFAIARKEVGRKHWGALGRAMSRWGSYAGPVSWTGTMFEFFMPYLLLPAADGSLLGEALAYCLYCQKRRTRAAGVPWGISESAFYAFDNNLNYQYKAHGVQKLGVKRYLDKELVISPYSTFLTLPFGPGGAMRNLDRLRELGVYGRYGFYEAVDFTTERVGKGGLAVTRSYMAHHIGMSMVASCNAVFDMRMQKRFMADNHMRSAEEFLQEKIAKSTVIYDTVKNAEAREEKQEIPRVREEKRDITPLAPQCMLLTNGELTDVLTDTGAGYLAFGNIDLTRRDSDLLRRAQGILTLVRMDGVTLPAAMAPFYDADASYSVEQEEQGITWLAEKKTVQVGVRAVIHPTISCQQRQIVVKNGSGTRQIAQVLCYLEPVLAAFQDYSAHPAYSKLFVTAAYDTQTHTLTFSRRNRDSTSDMFLTVGFLEDIEFEYETRREALMSAPEGMQGLLRFADKPFSSEGAGTPDACCALRFDLLVAPGGQQRATLLISAARSAAEGVRNIVAMRRAGVLEPRYASRSPLAGDSLEARIGAGALGQLLFTTADCTENRAEKRRNHLGQSALWSTGISGDLPIALVEQAAGIDPTTFAAYLRLHTALRRLSVEFDLVALCADEAQKDELYKLTEHYSSATMVGARGGVFLLLQSALPQEIVTLIRAVARHTAGGIGERPAAAPYRTALLRSVAPAPLPAQPELAVEGGCFEGGRFYVDKSSPLPWSHVLASPRFGTLVSDSSLGFTWAVNSRENKLTPWYNDIATDNTGEMCLLHDGESYYSLTHGARASFCKEDARWEGRTSMVMSEVRVTVSETGCCKYIDVLLRNRTDKPRELECAYYLEPVLGVSRETARHITAEAEGDVLALHNPYNTAVRCWAALTGFGGGQARLSVDRAAFLCGDWQSLELAPTNDPCAAVILPVRLPAEGEARLKFALGYGATMESAVYMVSQSLACGKTECGSIKITTPDAGLDQFINHFAPQQMLASRIYGRTAFYQCGGAFGFRDQLQDTCAFVLLDAQVARRQIARCCAVQFEEGDVLHWWHDLPGGLKGVRTRFADDLIWLPYAVAHYVEKTGDSEILDLQIHYLAAPELVPGVQEHYLAPGRSETKESVFAHCARALARAYNLGENGLPLIGCGDWCDGFSAVGRQGKGTSVWVALFLAIVLDKFALVCNRRGRHDLEVEYTEKAQALRRAVDEHGWDGKWYLRAFFDDGDKMGSHESEECKIDLLPQAFAVFADMPDRLRVENGLQSAFDRLVDHKLRLVRLYDPPFQHSQQQPGYARAYPSGIRENGGQYTHSAVWFAMALMRIGRVEDGWSILEMLNPVNRAQHSGLAQRYKLEPCYLAADIYTNPDAEGHGGWSLYTGAVSWYYRAVVETLLGLRLHGERLTLEPRLPAHWPQAEIRAEIRGTALRIRISRKEIAGLVCDGAPAEYVPLDGKYHEVVYGVGGGENQPELPSHSDAYRP